MVERLLIDHVGHRGDGVSFTDGDALYVPYTLGGETVESLIVRVANEALADAGVAAADVDEIVLGHFNAGFSAQDFTASLVLQASPELRFKRAAISGSRVIAP